MESNENNAIEEDDTMDGISEASKVLTKLIQKPSIEVVRTAEPVLQWAKHFTRSEVAFHNSKDDLWVSYFGSVYNVTKMDYPEKEMVSIYRNAGKDISHWFRAKDQLKMRVDPKTGLRVPLCPDGIINATNWWTDSKKSILMGQVSRKIRKVRIINTLTAEEAIMEYCLEEPIIALLERYKKINAHANAYSWRYKRQPLDLNMSFIKNGMDDDVEELYELNLAQDEWIPSILLYFSDNLTSG